MNLGSGNGECSSVTQEPHGNVACPWASRRWAWFGMLVLVLVGALHARLGPELSRPLEHDECATVRAFGSIPYDVFLPGYEGTGRWDLPLLARGLAKCFANHWDPANHLLNSLGVSVATFLFGASETVFRLPALLAGIVLCLLAAAWARHRSGSVGCGLLIGLAVAYHPYLICYSLSSRGYIWTVLLIFLQIVLLDFLSERESDLPLWTNVGMVLLGTLIFLNLVSTAVMWLVPLYAVGTWWWRSPQQPLRGVGQWGRHIWCRTPYQQWLAQGILVGCFVLLFLLLKLPDVLRSQAKYGTPLVDPLHQFGPLMRGLMGEFGPGLWLGLVLVSAVGWAVACTRWGYHWLGPVALFAVLLTGAYSVAGHKALYERTYGAWVPAAVLLCIHLWRRVADSRGRLRPVFLGMIALALLGGIAQGMVRVTRTPERYRRHSLADTPFYNQAAANLERVIAALPSRQRDSLILVPPYAWGLEMLCYLDQGRGAIARSPMGMPSFPLVLFSQREADHVLTRFRPPNRLQVENVFWPNPASSVADSPLTNAPVIGMLRFLAVPSRDQGPYLIVWKAGQTDTNAWDAALPEIRKNPLFTGETDHAAQRSAGIMERPAGFLWGEGRPPDELLALASTGNEREAVMALFTQLIATCGGTVQVWTLEKWQDGGGQ